MPALISANDSQKQLMTAARALALAMFSERSFGLGWPSAPVIVCVFCGHVQASDDYSDHAPGCKVGAVMACLRSLENDLAGPGNREVIEWPAGSACYRRDVAGGYADGYGEPWHVDGGEPGVVHDFDCVEVYCATTSELLELDEPRFARRVAACVNLCAGMPTEALENSFDQMTATCTRWGLVAMPLDDMTEERIAQLGAAIDRVIGGAA